MFGIILAHWIATAQADEKNAKWFNSQHNSAGQWCCDVADGHEYDGDYTVNPDGSVTIDPEGAKRTLPAYMILQGPNPTGHAVWWYIEGAGYHIDYCFAPGAGL